MVEWANNQCIDGLKYVYERLPKVGIFMLTMWYLLFNIVQCEEENVLWLVLSHNID